MSTELQDKFCSIYKPLPIERINIVDVQPFQRCYQFLTLTVTGTDAYKKCVSYYASTEKKVFEESEIITRDTDYQLLDYNTLGGSLLIEEIESNLLGRTEPEAIRYISKLLSEFGYCDNIFCFNDVPDIKAYYDLNVRNGAHFDISGFCIHESDKSRSSTIHNPAWRLREYKYLYMFFMARLEVMCSYHNMNFPLMCQRAGLLYYFNNRDTAWLTKFFNNPTVAKSYLESITSTPSEDNAQITNDQYSDLLYRLKEYIQIQHGDYRNFISIMETHAVARGYQQITWLKNKTTAAVFARLFKMSSTDFNKCFLNKEGAKMNIKSNTERRDKYETRDIENIISEWKRDYKVKE